MENEKPVVLSWHLEDALRQQQQQQQQQQQWALFAWL